MTHNPNQEARRRAADMFLAVDAEVRDNLVLALEWAQKTLGDRYAKGFTFQIYGGHDSELTVSFSTRDGSYTTYGHRTGSELVVMAVCEYLNQK